MNGRRLYRSRQDRILGGVAGGLADYLGLDPALIRIAWAVLVLASAGSLFLLYIVMWIVVPEAPPGFNYGAGGVPAPGSTEGAPMEASPSDGQPSPAGEAAPSSAPPPSIGHEWARHQAGRRTDWSGQGGLIVGALLILVGGWFLVRDYVPAFRNLDLWPTILIVVGVVLVVTAFRPRSD